MSRDLTALRQLQSLPLEAKIERSKRLISEWLETYPEAYISFSGGKDSTVLLHIARQIEPDIKAIFCNTGLEYPEIVQFVKQQDNVKIIKPEVNFKEVIIKYGYPFISKDISRAVYEAKKVSVGKHQYRIEQFNGTFKNNNGTKSIYDYSKYKDLLNADFELSNQCCNIMKKKPLHNYKHPMVGVLADESKNRLNNWTKYGCNIFNSKSPISRPLMIWTEQDILQYIKQNNLTIASVYGEIIEVNNHKPCISDCGNSLKCSGVQRTGCIFCGFGAHLDKRNNGVSRFVLLRKSHPKLYDYCMRGGQHINGIWQPSNDGLGMAYVINSLNNLYSKGKKKFIEY